MRKWLFIGFVLVFSGVCWGNPPTLPDTASIIAVLPNVAGLGPTNGRRIVRDSKGWLYIVHIEALPGMYAQLICRRSMDDGWHWSQIKVVSEEDTVEDGCLTMARGDTLHVFWVRYWDGQGGTVGKDLFWRWAKDTTWGPVVNLTNGHWLQQAGLFPMAAADTFGVVHLVTRFLDTGTMHYLRREGGVWHDTSFGYDGGLTQLTVDGFGEVHLVYTRPYAVYYRKRSTSGVWGLEELVSDSLYYASAPTVAVGGDYRPRVLYHGTIGPNENGRVFFSERLSGGIWRGPSLISTYSDKQWNTWPSSAIDDSNRLWVIWDYLDTIGGTQHGRVMGRKYDGTNWDTLTWLTDTAQSSVFSTLAERPWNGGADVILARYWGRIDTVALMYGWWPFSSSGVEVGKQVESKFEGLKLSVQSPSRHALNVSYSLPFQSKVSLILYDLSGRKVMTLDEGEKPMGRYEVRRSLGSPAGVYFLRLETGSVALTRKIVVLR